MKENLKPRKLEMKGKLFGIFFINIHCYNLFYVPNTVYLYEFQMSIAEHFSVD